MKSFTTLPLSEKVLEWQEHYKLSDGDAFLLMQAEYELDRFHSSRFAGASSLTNFNRDVKRFERELEGLIDGDWEFNPPMYPTEVYKMLRHRMENLDALRTFFNKKLPKKDELEQLSADEELDMLHYDGSDS